MKNILKHADAKEVIVQLTIEGRELLLVVEDDGKGFDLKNKNNGIGLKNIDSRVGEVGGKAEVFSKIDIGTVIKLFIPLA